MTRGRSAASPSRNRRHAVNDSSRLASPAPSAAFTPTSGPKRDRIHSRSDPFPMTASTAADSFFPASPRSSVSRMPAWAFTISPRAQKVIPSP
jgi:hypothetical protein